MSLIVFKNDSGGVSVIYPAPDALLMYGIEYIAQKDVPTGKPYKIVDPGFLPATRENRDSWTIDEAELTDGIGG